MERTSEVFKPEFIYGIGDNFYFWGVEDVHDVMWTKTFENVYKGEHLQVFFTPKFYANFFRAKHFCAKIFFVTPRF